MKTEKELLSVIASYEKQGIGGDTGALATERAEALDRYFGRAYGNEQEGHSAVVSKDISDAVDWIMPSLLRVFLSSDDIVRFDPVGPEDADQAEQESDYVNHVIMKDNNGFCVLHDWFKDALLLKNGYVKRWWDVTEEITHESYTNLTEEDLTILMMEIEQTGDEIDVVGQETKQVPGQTGIIEVYDVKLRRKRKKGKVCIEPVPPEEIVVASTTRTNLQESPFVQHVTVKSRSDLVEMGLSKEYVESLPSYHVKDDEAQSRDTSSDELNMADNPDRAMEEVEYKENYLKVDADEDGIAELRCIISVGGKIPEGEKWNQEIDCIPISTLTPNRLAHRHIGLSVYDELKDLAEIKTALIRGTLDNTYQLVNSEWMLNERANLSDFLQSRPNGVKRIMGKEPIGDAATQVIKQPIIQHVIPVLDYLDTLKETRTGVGRNVMGLDADTLKKTTEGAAKQALQQANQKIEMIARVFAETGVKDLALAVHALLIKHQDKEKVVKLRNNWVRVNPQEWKTRTDLTVSVGLGTGSQEEVRANIMALAGIQEKAAQAGIVTPRNVYNLATKAANSFGFKQEGEFFTDPDSPEVQQMQQGQQQPNPLAEAEQIKGQFRMEADKMKHEMEHMHEMQKQEFEKYKFDQEHALEIAKAEIEAAKNAVPADLGKPGMGTETKEPMSLSIAELGEVAGAATNGVAQMAEQLQTLIQQNQQMWQAMIQHMSQPVTVVSSRGTKFTATRGNQELQ